MVFWISGLAINLSTQSGFGFEFWEAGIASIGICTCITFLPAIILIFLGMKIKKELKDES
ncbi:MAG: hypothetical protein ACPL1Y_00710 [Thermoplasmata archaeon]